MTRFPAVPAIGWRRQRGYLLVLLPALGLPGDVVAGRMHDGSPFLSRGPGVLRFASPATASPLTGLPAVKALGTPALSFRYLVGAAALRSWVFLEGYDLFDGGFDGVGEFIGVLEVLFHSFGWFCNICWVTLKASPGFRGLPR